MILGLLGSVLTAPVKAPARGLSSIIKTIHQAAEDQFFSPEAIRAEIVRLEGLLDAGEMTEEEFETLEDSLLDRLEAVEAAQAGQVD